MQTKLFLLPLVAVVASVLTGAEQDISPVSSWNFDGALADAEGQTKDNMNVGGKETSPRFVSPAELPGVKGKAIALGIKTSDVPYLTAPTSADVKLGPSYTIEAWIHPTQISAWNRMVLNWGSAYAYHFAINNGVLSLYHGQADGKYLFAEGGTIHAGRWYHAVGVARRNDKNPADSKLEVYLNGQRTASASYDGTIRTLEEEGLGIGDAANGNGTAIRFRGYIDEVTIWNCALSASQIQKRCAMRADILSKVAVAEKTPSKPSTSQTGARTSADWAQLEVDEIVFAERHPGRDISGHYYANFGYACIDEKIWFHGADGGRLCRLNPATGKLTAIVDDPKGAVRDPQVHYDAKKILFSYRKGGTHHYHLYEVNVDGTGLKQLTDGPWDDVEPTYLPDGDIIFASTRCKRYILCWLAQAATLHRCNADGEHIRMLSSNTVTENTPAVLPDGRVIYTRWEYVNRDPVVFHHLWSMNPDGTGQKAYFGNMHPGGVFIDAKPIPGSDQVVFTHSPGHGRNEHAGDIALVSDRNGPDDRKSMRNISKGGTFRDPYAISPNAFLVVHGNQILLMNATGQTKVLYRGKMMVHEPSSLRKRNRERVIPSRLDPTKTTGTIVLNNAYIGRNMEGVKPGSIKKLLVLEDLPKPVNFHGGGSQPLGHGVTSTLKRLLGTVPVEEDGSAHFEVPAMRSIYLAILDEQDRSIKQMRSFMTLQPGEITSCVGCHEPRSRAPHYGGQPILQALDRPASKITPFANIPDVLDFPRDVQPILDKHCVRCHDHKERKGNVVLTGDRGPVFSHSYYELLFQWQVKDTSGNPSDRSGRQMGNDKPYTTYSSASPLMKKIDGSHYQVKLSEREEAVIRLWIDVSAQYPGTVAAIGTGQIGGCWGNNKYIREMAQQWPSTGPASDAVKRRCLSCHQHTLPTHVTDTLKGLSFADMLSWERPLSRFSRHRVFNLNHPERSLMLMAPLAKGKGGYADGKPEKKKVAENRSAAPKPVTHPVVFESTEDPDYRKILTHIQAAKAKLQEIKRFDMPGFKPNSHYVREMKRYAVLPQTFDLQKDEIDVYEIDQKYWRSMWPGGEGAK